MAVEHNFSALVNGSSSAWSLMSGVNEASFFVLAYGISFLVLIGAFWFVSRKTQDVSKSWVFALFITTMVDLILYYGGKVFGTDFVPDVLMLGLVCLTAVVAGVLFFARYDVNENR